MGTPSFAVPPLRGVLDGPHELLAVVTQADRPAGRGRKSSPSPVKKAALDASIPVLEPLSVREESFLDRLRELCPDVIVVVAFGQILPKSLLDLPPRGCLNVHASLLPKYRGAAPIQWAILRGERRTGVTVIQMTEGVDEGDILLAEALEVGEDDAQQLGERLSVLGAGLLRRALEALESGTLRGTPQRHEDATYAPRLRRADGLIPWEKSAEEICLHIRGMKPWPGSYTRWGEKQLKIHRARPAGCGVSGKPGQVVRADHGVLWVRTGDGCLDVLEVQLENRPKMAARAFVPGHQNILGAILR